MAFLSGYTKRRLVTLDHSKIDSDKTDFPTMVNLASFPDWDWDQLNNDGFDVRFTQYDGETLLKYEREQHIDNSKGVYWVKIPQIKSTSGQDANKFWIYYRTTDTADGADPTNVWNANHKAVWHLKESGDGTADEFKDSTSNAVHGTGGSGAYPDQIDGKIGKGQDFVGNTLERIEMGTSFMATYPIAGTISFWVKVDTINTGDYANMMFIDGAIYHGIYFTTDNKLRWRIYHGSVRNLDSVSAISTGTWYRVTLTWDINASEKKLYLNDAVDNSNADGNRPGDNAQAFDIGAYTASYNSHDGILDEFRVEDTARDLAWTKASYNSELNTLLTYGAEEEAPAGTNSKINIADVWKDASEMKINIGDAWKAVAKVQINIGDSWKTIFG